MTPREIIFANLEHQGPERPGLNFDGDSRIDDFIWGGLGPSAVYRPKRWVEGNKEFYDDEWGNLWLRMVDGCNAGEVYRPALADWRDLETLPLPDWDNPRRFDAMRATFAQPTDKFKSAFLPGWPGKCSRTSSSPISMNC